MLKKIDKNNPIFMSEEYQKDSHKFFLIAKNFDSPSLELYSDEENYIICRGRKDLPTWIWSKDNINLDIVKEIEEGIKLYLKDAENNKFTCKKELYDLMKKDEFVNLDAYYFEMGFLECEKTIKPRETDGYMDIPKEEEKDIIALYWYKDCLKMNDCEPITMEQAKLDTEDFYASNRFFIWRNSDEKIVSMVYYSIVDNQAKLGHVYTNEEERKKGYAANLIYSLTNELLKQGLVPLLYTDYNYLPSNRAYMNAGYEDKGILVNFSCSKNK